MFYAIPQNRAILHCPIQPGALVQYYYGRWEKDGNTLIQLPQPINGNPQEIVRSDSRYDLDRTTFSLIINSVEVSDAGDDYPCILYVVDPRNDLPINLQTGTAHLMLMVNGKQGRSQDFREGGAEYICAREARAQILATPTYEMERSKFKLSQRTRSDGS